MAGTEQVKGPRSYFLSIEKTCGKPVEEWQAGVHGRANALVAETLREDRP